MKNIFSENFCTHAKAEDDHDAPKKNLPQCPYCKNPIINIEMSPDDFFTIREASNYNRKFLEAMISLKEKDIIEYELKMSQFRTNVAQKEVAQKTVEEDNNKPRCPKCGSTNIQLIQRKWSFLKGFTTNKTDRVCINCKHKW